MANIVYRGAAAPTVANAAANKNAPLTNDEIDKNLFALNDAAITIGTTAIKPSNSSTTLAGLTSVTSTSFVGGLTGNASTATKLATARGINGVDFDGSAAITVTAAAGTLSGATLASGVTASSLTSVGTLASLTTSGDVTVGRNLIVNGITTSINSTTLTVDDKNIELGSVGSSNFNITGNITAGSAVITAVSSTANIIPGSAIVSGSGFVAVTLPAGLTVASVDSATQITVSAVLAGTGTATGATLAFSGATDATANGGGITLKGATDKTIAWDSTNSNWTSSENWNIASGKVFKINNATVLNATTLGSNIVNSSLTKLGTGAGFVKSDASGNLTADTNTYLTSAGDGALTVSTVAAALTNNTVTLALSGAYSANTTTARTLDLKVGPALTNLATLMTTAGAGFIRRGATADTYSIDTSTYLTSYTEADTLATVTGRGASTSTAITLNNGTTNLGHATTNYITTSDNGSIIIKTKNQTTRQTGLLNIQTGNTTLAGSWTGGILIKTGDATGGTEAYAGDISIYPGSGDLSGASVNITGGDSAGGVISVAGAVTIKGGNVTAISTGGTTSGIAGNLYLYGGDVVSASSFAKTSGSVYIEGGGANGSGTITYGSINIGTTSASSSYGTSVVNIGNSAIATVVNGTVKLPNVGTSGFVKLGAGGQLSADTSTYLTAEADTLATVTARGATTATASTFSGGLSATGGFTSSTDISVNGMKIGRGTANGDASNTAFGTTALAVVNSIRNGHTAIGYNALAVNVQGDKNTAIGAYALAKNTDGGNNVAVGTSALYNNLIGNYNTGMGYQVLYNTTGSANTAFGSTALSSNIAGSYNTAIGQGSLSATNGAAANYNTAIGNTAGNLNSTGANNVFIGADAQAANSGDSNTIVIGKGAVGLGSNTTVIGNSSTTATTIKGTLTVSSSISATNLSGTNTGDQTLPTTLPHNGTALSATTGTFSGAVTLTTIAATAANALSITGAPSSTTAGTAYAVNITGGTGSDSSVAGKGGAVNITGGRSGNNGTGSGAVMGGVVTITGGAGNTLFNGSAPGGVVIAGGAAQIAGQRGADVSISASDGAAPVGTDNSSGGDVFITAGAGRVTGNNGIVAISAPGGAGGTAAVITFRAGSSERARINTGLSVGTTTDAGSTNILAAGNITAYSDARIKTNIVKITDALDKVEQLNGYTFDRTDTEGPRQTGVIAQEVLKVLPEAVLGSEDTTYSVAYGNMMGLMIEAIKELNAKVTDLQNQLANK